MEIYNESEYGYVRHLKNWGAYQNLTSDKKNWVKPNSSAVSNNFILCYHSSFFDNSSVLTKEKKTLVSESKESLLAMRDKPFWNRSTRSASLYLFKRIQFRLTPLLGCPILGFF